MSPEVMLDVLGTLPADVLIAFAWTRILRMRSNVLFFALLVGFVTLVVAADRNAAGSLARFLFLVVGYGVLPFAMSVDRPLRKLLVIALANVVIVVAEFVSLAGWYLMTGLDIMDHGVVFAHMGEYVLTHVVHLVVLGALFWGLRTALNRFDRGGTDGFRGFVWFPVMQAALLGLPLAIGVYLGQGSDVLYYGTAALSLVCFAADAALFASMGRYARKVRDEERAEALQRQLDSYLGDYAPVAEALERTSRMRHDLRNQVQVIEALGERGDYVAARDHARELSLRMDSDLA